MDLSKQAQQDGRNLAREVFAKLNVMSYEDNFIEGFLDGLSREHRTLQQGFGRLMFKIIRHFADEYEDGRFDARNASLCAACHEMAKISDKMPMPFI